MKRRNTSRFRAIKRSQRLNGQDGPRTDAPRTNPGGGLAGLTPDQSRRVAAKPWRDAAFFEREMQDALYSKTFVLALEFGLHRPGSVDLDPEKVAALDVGAVAASATMRGFLEEDVPFRLYDALDYLVDRGALTGTERRDELHRFSQTTAADVGQRFAALLRSELRREAGLP